MDALRAAMQFSNWWQQLLERRLFERCDELNAFDLLALKAGVVGYEEVHSCGASAGELDCVGRAQSAIAPERSVHLRRAEVEIDQQTL